MRLDMDEQVKQEYQEYVKEVTPTHNLWLQMAKAFFVGGVICVVGQLILNYCTNTMGMDKETAGSWCSLLLILASIVLTGLNIYPSIVKFGGAGALVPITGFANSVASPAIEFKTEGFVYGMAAKMFVVAGPIIVFGVSAGAAVGLIYWLLAL